MYFALCILSHSPYIILCVSRINPKIILRMARLFLKSQQNITHDFYLWSAENEFRDRWKCFGVFDRCVDVI